MPAETPPSPAGNQTRKAGRRIPPTTPADEPPMRCSGPEMDPVPLRLPVSQVSTRFAPETARPVRTASLVRRFRRQCHCAPGPAAALRLLAWLRTTGAKASRTAAAASRPATECTGGKAWAPWRRSVRARIPRFLSTVLHRRPAQPGQDAARDLPQAAAGARGKNCLAKTCPNATQTQKTARRAPRAQPLAFRATRRSANMLRPPDFARRCEPGADPEARIAKPAMPPEIPGA